ncbi:hypothetical protein EBZ38_16515, partial [bacterium]|nr:hypothetical protein [bacterium]
MEPGESSLGTILSWCWALASSARDGIETPSSLKEALKGPQASHWQAAADKEMQAIKDFGVIGPSPMDLPPGRTTVDSKMVLKIKRHQDGSIERYKCRLVARGFSQVKGEDYSETFSSVGKWATIRLLLALAVILGWEVEVCDVDNAFLNSTLNEEVYVKQPAGLDDGTGRVYRINKALYGLKQAPRTWEQNLGGFLSKRGFKRCVSDQALYTRHDKRGLSMVLIYVDDL